MRYSLLFLILAGTAGGCVADDGDEQFLGSEVLVPSRGAATTLDVGEWNLEFFGAPSNGPSNDALQVANARDVISGADLDLWGLEEMVDTPRFNELKAQLPGYSGFLSNDPIVTNGSAFYGTNEQKLGILFKTSVITVQSARLILTQNDAEFAGRPPLEVKVTANVDGDSIELYLIVLHAKAFSDTTSYNKRVAMSGVLKTYLDGTRASDRVIVVGDYNDDIDVSITSGRVSPYKNFVDDTARYDFPTMEFSLNNDQTTVGNSQAIDHHLATNEIAGQYLDGSAEVYRVDAFIANYGDTTSDHFPTLTRYSLGGGMEPPPTGAVILNEILANEVGSDFAGEAIELVNTGSATADLSGFTLSDSGGVRHTFAGGTTLAAGRALVVASGPPGLPSGVTGVFASTGTLSLNNNGDTVTLRSAAGATVDSFAYPAALSGTDGVSMNRSPDGNASGGFVAHTALGGASSIGRRANGASF